MPNPFNPLDWIRLSQDWFRQTEKSSGFRPYLIFLLMLFGFSLVLLSFFPSHPITLNLIPLALEIGIGVFVVVFAIKAMQDPSFCRSEKHIENIKRLEVMEQKGDAGPQVIEGSAVEIMGNPQANTALVNTQAQSKQTLEKK